MGFNGLVMTKDGKKELLKAATGETLNFTHIVFGSGSANGLYSSKSALTKEIFRLPITDISRRDEKIVIALDYNNQMFPEDFYFRELGVIGNGMLCYYDNAGEDAEYIEPGNAAISKEKRLRIEIIVGKDADITTTSESGLYALETEVTEKVEEITKNIDGLTKEKEEVTEKVEEITKKVDEQLGTHTLKSDVPEDARFTDTTYSAGRGIDITNNAFRLADYCQIHSDWNKALGNGFWMASGAANAPTTDGWYYGITIAHNNLYCRQILYRFAANSTILDGNSDRFERVYQNGKWGVWYNTTVRKDVPANAQFTDTKYTHPAYTAQTGAPTDNQSPNHGGSFMMAQPVSDGLGHITAINARTVNMPNIYVDYNVAAGTHSHTLNTSQRYLLIGTATYSSNTWNFICHLKYTSSWQCINVAGNGAPNTSISGNTLTVVLAGSGTVYTSSYILLRIV